MIYFHITGYRRFRRWFRILNTESVSGSMYVFFINNYECVVWQFDDFVDCIFSIEIKMKDTTDSARSGSYLDLRQHNDSDGRVQARFFARSLVVCVVLCRSLFVLMSFSFYHYVVCPSICSFDYLFCIFNIFL